jgi:hypothetical protein
VHNSRVAKKRKVVTGTGKDSEVMNEQRESKNSEEFKNTQVDDGKSPGAPTSSEGNNDKREVNSEDFNQADSPRTPTRSDESTESGNVSAADSENASEEVNSVYDTESSSDSENLTGIIIEFYNVFYLG